VIRENCKTTLFYRIKKPFQPIARLLESGGTSGLVHLFEVNGPHGMTLAEPGARRHRYAPPRHHSIRKVGTRVHLVLSLLSFTVTVHCARVSRKRASILHTLRLSMNNLPRRNTHL
jgi:hypothetical protein